MDPNAMKAIVARWKPSYADTRLLCMFLGDKPDFAWVPTDKIKHFARARQECLPGKKDKKYKSVMKAVKEADAIENDPRDMTKKQATQMLELLDTLLLEQAMFSRGAARRLALTVDPGLLEKEKRAAAQRPIWARD